MEGRQEHGLIRNLARKLALAIGTGFGSGYFPIAPGTVGSAVGVAIYAALVELRALSGASHLGWLVVLGAVFALGWPSARHLEARFGCDNKRIVIDEVWGMLVSLAFLPPSAGYAVAAFLLFRIFDIVKPFPARQAERVSGGAGVMLDDGIAGLYACLALHIFRLLMG
jgi:phosphatidylglycerophosphatase A